MDSQHIKVIDLVDLLRNHSVDDNKALMYICNNKYPKKSKINDFKNDYDYLIDEFFKYTVKMGVDLDLVDFETVTLDSTPY